jgi:hypothetical protein
MPIRVRVGIDTGSLLNCTVDYMESGFFSAVLKEGDEGVDSLK